MWEGEGSSGGSQLGSVSQELPPAPLLHCRGCTQGSLCSGCGDAEGLLMSFEYAEHPFNESVMLESLDQLFLSFFRVTLNSVFFRKVL